MNAKRYARLLVAMVLLLPLAAGLTHAQGPGPEGTLSPQAALGTAFTYQGRLEDASGPVDSTCDFRFILYGSSNGADQIGVPQPKTNAPVSNGYFAVDDLDFGAIAFTGQARWLEIELRCPAGTGAYTTLSPRQPLTATPYALYALNVATHNHLGQTWSGSNNPLVINGSFSKSPNNAPLVLSNSHSSGDGLRVISAGRDGVFVGSADYGLHVSSVDDDGVYVTSAGGDGVAVASAGDDGLYVYSAGDDGVSVRSAGNPSMTSPSTDHNGLEVAGAEGSGLFIGRADLEGVFVFSAAGDGVSVRSAGRDGLHVSSAGYCGVLVRNAAQDGLYVLTAGDDGVDIGSAGDRGVSVGSAEYGLVVDTADYGVVVTSADSDGVVVTSAGDDGVVVNSAGGDGVYVGTVGSDGVVVSSAGGDGVQVSADLDGVYVGSAGYHGVAVNSAGHNGLDVHYAGEDGLHVSSAGDDGVYVGAVGDYGAYFNGTVYATFFAGPGASSRIDHPLDPENLYLNHSFVGSPDMMNIYNGNVTLDAAGEAWVELPAWFEALNQSFRYQLTPVGAPGPDLYIAEEVRDNRFKIAGGAAGMRVSWQVTGIRHDPYAEAGRVPVERDKPPQERGTYLSPEAYGLPETMGLAYRKDQTAGDRAAASGR